MNKKLLRTVFAVLLSVFMFGTSINPAVFAEGNDETVENNEGNGDDQEKGTDVRKTITEFVLGELIPDEAENTEDEALPASLPAKLEGDAEETEPVAVGVEWTENENVFNVALNAESNEAYVLSENAQNQLDSISVAKSEAKDEETEKSENDKTEKPAEPAGDEKQEGQSSENQEIELDKKDLQQGSQKQLLGNTRQTKPDTPTGLEWENTTLYWETVDGLNYELSFEIENDTSTDSDTFEWDDGYFPFKHRMHFMGPSCTITASLTAIDEDENRSEPATTSAKFYQITRTLINLDADGNPTDQELGTVRETEPEFANFVNTGNHEFIKDGESVALQASTAYGRDDVAFKGFGFDSEPTDKVVTGNKVTFTADKPLVFTATFQISNEKSPVLIDFGKNHTAFADKFFAAYKDSEELTIDENHILSLRVYSHWSRSQVLRKILNMTRSLVFDPEIPVEGIIDNDENLITFGKKSIDEYSDEDEYRDEYSKYESETISQNNNFVALWQQSVTTGEFTLTAPLCGTVVTMSEEYSSQTNAPDINPTANSQLKVREQMYFPGSEVIKDAYWIMMPDESPFSGTIIGGNDYTCLFMVQPISFKYYLNYQEAPQITVNGVPVSITSIGYIVDITAEHDWDNGTITTKPTCTKKGVKTYKCNGCEETKTEDVDPLGHKWGEWTVTKVPTASEDGSKKRVCEHDSSHFETEKIDKVTYDVTSGNGQEWTIGSSGTADFEFSRSWEDEELKQTAYDLFTEIDVDGKKVTDFTKDKGSVITKISGIYMNTLSVGEHTITAKFSDGGSVTAAFTVKKGSEPTAKSDDNNNRDSGYDPCATSNPALGGKGCLYYLNGQIVTANGDGTITTAAGNIIDANGRIINTTRGTAAKIASPYEFRFNHEIARFSHINVDGIWVDRFNYVVRSGSTIITLKQSYIDTLSVGTHTLTAYWTDGTTMSYQFTVSLRKRAGVPNTGDMDLMIYAWAAMLAMTMAIYCGVKLLHEDWEV